MNSDRAIWPDRKAGHAHALLAHGLNGALNCCLSEREGESHWLASVSVRRPGRPGHKRVVVRILRNRGRPTKEGFGFALTRSPAGYFKLRALRPLDSGDSPDENNPTKKAL
jgi:hypothetical protein